jgi:hypothetical protein
MGEDSLRFSFMDLDGGNRGGICRIRGEQQIPFELSIVVVDIL